MPPEYSKYILFCGLLSATVLTATPALSQTTPDITVAAALTSLSAQAGSVFAGEVVAIRHNGGIVEVEFRIDQSIKGQASGDIVLREWAGLWAAGQRRYWLGERAVVFLHDAGKSGLSSSVDGMEGILQISPDATDSPSVDIQRIRTRVMRDSGAPMVDSTTHMTLAEVATTLHSGLIDNPLPPPVHLQPVTLQPVETPNEFPQDDASALRIPTHKITHIVRQLEAR